MENTIDTMDNLSEQSFSFGSRIADEVTRSHQQASSQTRERHDLPESFKMNDYLQVLRDFFATSNKTPDLDQILPPELLNNLITKIHSSAKLKAHYPQGYKIQLAVIPFNLNGIPLTEPEINEGKHFQVLVLDSADASGNLQTIGGYTAFPSYVNRILPVEMQQVCFTVDPYDDPDNVFNVTANDRQRLERQVTTCFNLLKNTLRRYLSN